MQAMPYFFAAAFCSLIICLLVMKYASRFGLIDLPGGRKVHTTLVPRAGGLAVALTYLLFAVVTHQSLSLLTSLGALFVFMGGLYDDLRPTNTVSVKLSFQILGSLLAAADLYFNYHVGLGLSFVSFGFILFMINSFNLMDNMNGLTAGMSLVLLATFAFMGVLTVVHASLLCGALVGFLVLNYPWGRIFLGDQGSQFLGYLLSAFALQAVTVQYERQPTLRELAFCIVFLLIAFLPFLFDTALVTAIRLYNRKPITTGDQNHLSHQLVRRGINSTAVPLLLIAFQALCAGGSYAWLIR